MKKEPLVSAAVLISMLGAVLALLQSFGLDITNDQQASISGLALVVAPLLVALLVRPKVTPVPTTPGDAGAVDVLVTVVISAVVSVLAVLITLLALGKL